MGVSGWGGLGLGDVARIYGVAHIVTLETRTGYDVFMGLHYHNNARVGLSHCCHRSIRLRVCLAFATLFTR